jgi:hypothetical protein
VLYLATDHCYFFYPFFTVKINEHLQIAGFFACRNAIRLFQLGSSTPDEPQHFPEKVLRSTKSVPKQAFPSSKMSESASCCTLHLAMIVAQSGGRSFFVGGFLFLHGATRSNSTLKWAYRAYTTTQT